MEFADPKFDPVCAAAEEMGAVLFIHPTGKDESLVRELLLPPYRFSLRVPGDAPSFTLRAEATDSFNQTAETHVSVKTTQDTESPRVAFRVPLEGASLFAGTKARFERADNVITLIAESEFQTRQMLEILQTKLGKRGIDIDCLELGTVRERTSRPRQ